MQVRSIQLRRFQGFEDLRVVPRGDVVLVGEPRAGRSTILEALFRVLSPDGARGTLSDDLDFWSRDRTQRIEIEVVLGDLGDDLTQTFFDKLEYWDEDGKSLIDELDALDGLDEYEQVVRLCYRARWIADQEHAEHWVDFPKTSDPAADAFERVRRADLAALPAFFGSPSSRPLGLSQRADFRELVDASTEADFASALEALAQHVQALGDGLVDSKQLAEALRAVFEPVAPALGVDIEDLNKQVAFVPAGLALGALLRSLEPTLGLDRAGAALPLSRHGSTASAVLAAAELMARGTRGSGVVAIDDFGEHVDAPTARHLAATLRRRSGQVWLSTRRAEVAAAFRPQEIVRLSFDDNAARTAHPGRKPVTKAQRSAARHLGLQLLPAVTARGIVVLEGPHDRAGLQAVAERRLRRGKMLPAAHRVALIDAGAADASGGSSVTPRVCEEARHLGFFTVAVIDGDPKDEDTVAANVAAADAVIRLPDGMAIERVLLHGIADKDVHAACKKLDVQLPQNFEQLSGRDLERSARKLLKSGGGLHAEFVDALPTGGAPPKLAIRILDEATRCIVERDRGLKQL